MDKISLEWFFQIPGLFITIGVLLILIALLILIISNSKARKRRESMQLEEEESTNSFDVPLSNPSETVNIVSNQQNNLDNLVANVATNVVNLDNVIENKNVVENNLNPIVETSTTNSIEQPIVNQQLNDEPNMTVAENNQPIISPVNIVDAPKPTEEPIVTPIVVENQTSTPVEETPIMSFVSNDTLNNSVNVTPETIMPTEEKLPTSNLENIQPVQPIPENVVDNATSILNNNEALSNDIIMPQNIEVPQQVTEIRTIEPLPNEYANVNQSVIEPVIPTPVVDGLDKIEPFQPTIPVVENTIGGTIDTPVVNQNLDAVSLETNESEIEEII